MTLLQFFILQYFGVGCGVLKIGGEAKSQSDFAHLLDVHYLIEISDNFFINESIEYWQKSHKEAEGTRSKECEFSCLFIDETAILRYDFFKSTKWSISLGAGPGLGIHLLKNYVKDISESGGWVTTDYYALTENTMGFHIATMVGVNFRKFAISGVAKYGIILVDDTKNLFYTQGDIKESGYSIIIDVNRGIR